jgi:hypothetical protein
MYGKEDLEHSILCNRITVAEKRGKKKEKQTLSSISDETDN